MLYGVEKDSRDGRGWRDWITGYTETEAREQAALYKRRRPENDYRAVRIEYVRRTDGRPEDRIVTPVN